MSLVDIPIFHILLFWIVLGMLYYAYTITLKGKIPPVTRKGEWEEHVAKIGILESHGKKPRDPNRKYYFGGRLSRLKTDEDIEGIDWDDEMENVP